MHFEEEQSYFLYYKIPSLASRSGNGACSLQIICGTCTCTLEYSRSHIFYYKLTKGRSGRGRES